MQEENIMEAAQINEYGDALVIDKTREAAHTSSKIMIEITRSTL